MSLRRLVSTIASQTDRFTKPIALLFYVDSPHMKRGFYHDGRFPSNAASIFVDPFRIARLNSN